MNVATVAKRTALAGAAFWGLAGGATAGLWYQLFRRPLPRTGGTLSLAGLDGRIEIARDRWAVPHIRATTAHDLWFAQGFCHGQDRLWQIDLYRRIGAGRVAQIAGSAGLQTDRFMRTLGLRRTAECGGRRAGSRRPRRAGGVLRRRERGGRRSAPAGRVPDPAPGLRPVRPSRRAHDDEAPLLRAVDQLGAGAPAGRDDAGAGAGAGRAPGSRLPEGQSGGAHARRGLERRRPGARRADREASRHDRPRGRGDRLQQLGRDRRAIGHGRTAHGRRSPSPAQHARHHVPGGPPPGRPLLPRRVATGAARRDDGAEQRRRVVVHQRHGGRDGPLHRADRGRRVRGRRRAAPAGADRRGDRGQGPLAARSPDRAKDRAWPDRQRGASRRRGRAAGAAVLGARFPRDHPGQPRPSSTSRAAPSWWRASPTTVTRSRTSCGPTATARSATRPSGASRCVAATARTCPSPGGPASTSGTAGSPTTSCRRSRTRIAATSSPPTTGSRRPTIPHHITSDYLDGYRARRIEELLDARPEHDLESFESIQMDMQSIPGSRPCIASSG